MSTQGIVRASDEQIERLRRLASDSDDAVDCALTAVLDDHKRMSDELERYQWQPIEPTAAMCEAALWCTLNDKTGRDIVRAAIAAAPASHVEGSK